MIRRVPAPVGRIFALVAVAAGLSAIGAATAGAATIIAYDNLNTVPKTVNGLPNEDTFSLDAANFAAGGQIELGNGIGGVPKSLTTEFDVFSCEHGVYYLENCLTLKPKNTSR